MWPYNAIAKLRASRIKGERSELPKIARQFQRSLYGGLEISGVHRPTPREAVFREDH